MIATYLGEQGFRTKCIPKLEFRTRTRIETSRMVIYLRNGCL